MENINKKVTLKRTKSVSWKRLYKFKNKNHWVSEPHKYSEFASELVKNGKVLDIGCGEGYDAVYFVKNGYAVSAFDISKDEVQNIKKNVRENKLKIKAFVADILKYTVKENFDIIVSYGVLQFLGKKSQKYFANLKSKTNLHGVHAFYIFGEKGDFAQIAKEKFWFPYKKELRQIYKDWKVLKLQEKKVKLLIKGDKGEDLYNNMYKILVQRNK